MSELHLELLYLWSKLEALPTPLPSHRNKTMTTWAAVFSEVSQELTIASNRALAMQEDLRQADAHARKLSAEIERLRGENRLILEALGMEKYRVLWRPVVEGGEMPPNGTPVLAVVRSDDSPCRRRRWVVRAKYAGKYTVDCSYLDYDGDADYCEEKDGYYWPEGWYEWNDGEEMHYMIGDTVTHWAPLPGLPEEE